MKGGGERREVQNETTEWVILVLALGGVEERRMIFLPCSKIRHTTFFRCLFPLAVQFSRNDRIILEAGCNGEWACFDGWRMFLTLVAQRLAA